MARPPIDYAQTSDGASIAYWSIGGGPPILICSHILEAHLPGRARLGRPLELRSDGHHRSLGAALRLRDHVWHLV